jgi:hypothetical protein
MILEIFCLTLDTEVTDEMKQFYQLVLSVKVLRYFEALPTFPGDLRTIVNAIKPFVDVPLDDPRIEEMMKRDDVVEAFELLKKNTTEGLFNCKSHYL